MRLPENETTSASRVSVQTALYYLASIVVMIVTLAIQSTGCKKGPVPVVTPERTPIPPPAGMTVSIGSIDGIPPKDMQEVGKDVLVELISSRSDAVVCVLVHPLLTDTWWVQNLPSLPNKGADGGWHWRTAVFCGTENLGRREKYEIVGVAEAEQAICVAGRQLKVAEANRHLASLARSSSVTVKRVRD